MDYPGKIISRANLEPTLYVASGMWTLSQAAAYTQAGLWPGTGFRVIQSFTASGSWTAPEGVTQVDYLVVAGGGSGGAGGGLGGGGGAGGV